MIKLNRVSKEYGKIKALNNISLEIQGGICYGLIGPNGAGKSTLMKILAGILNDFEGEATLFNLPLKKAGEDIKKQIGYIPQDVVLEDKLSAYDNLRFFGSIYGLKGKELEQRIHEVLEMVGLVERKNDAIQTFSGGMKRRINIGCALLHSPKIIIMDEPTVGVDPQSRNHIFEIIHQLKREGKTILYSSHYMEEVENLCEAIALIDHGDVVENGMIKEILHRHSTPSIFVESTGLAASDLMPVGHVIPKKEGFIVECEDTIIGLEKITKLISAKEREVSRLEIAKPNLEDIFLRLTGSTLRD